MNKIETFETNWRKACKASAKTGQKAGGVLMPHVLTAHPSVNQCMVDAFGHALNGELQAFDACMAQAKAEFARIKAENLAAMRAR